MGCYICGRGNCMPSFHSLEEQEYFEEAYEAYEHYLEVRARCQEEYNTREEDE